MNDYTLKELRDSIRAERRYVNRRPYSHNIIAIDLSMIEEKFGVAEANRAIDDFRLHLLGWHKRSKV